MHTKTGFLLTTQFQKNAAAPEFCPPRTVFDTQVGKLKKLQHKTSRPPPPQIKRGTPTQEHPSEPTGTTGTANKPTKECYKNHTRFWKNAHHHVTANDGRQNTATGRRCRRHAVAARPSRSQTVRFPPANRLRSSSIHLPSLPTASPRWSPPLRCPVRPHLKVFGRHPPQRVPPHS